MSTACSAPVPKSGEINSVSSSGTQQPQAKTRQAKNRPNNGFEVQGTFTLDLKHKHSLDRTHPYRSHVPMYCVDPLLFGHVMECQDPTHGLFGKLVASSSLPVSGDGIKVPDEKSPRPAIGAHALVRRGC